MRNTSNIFTFPQGTMARYTTFTGHIQQLNNLSVIVCSDTPTHLQEPRREYTKLLFVPDYDTSPVQENQES
jgi:hypothetical protein